MTMKCPKCEKTMITVKRGKIEIDHCIGCKGIWFDRAELGHLSNMLAEIEFKVPKFSDIVEVKNSPEVKVCSCVRCKKEMKKGLIFNMPPLVDYCADGDGIWFDGGELGSFVRNNKKRDKSSTLVTFLSEILSSKLSVKK